MCGYNAHTKVGNNEYKIEIDDEGGCLIMNEMRIYSRCGRERDAFGAEQTIKMLATLLDSETLAKIIVGWVDCGGEY